MTMPTNDSDINVSTDRVLELAGQLSNGDSQPPQQGQEGSQDQRIPYERFKEVNDERKAYQEQNNKLLEMMERYQTMQNQPQQQVQPDTQPVRKSLFTDEELDSFEQDIVLDPKSTLQKFGDAILNRGVEDRVKALEASFQEKLTALTGQMTANTLPTLITSFKQNRFTPNQGAEAAAFDEVLKTIDPSLLSNPATLENVRLAAIGYVADQRASGTLQNRPAPFSETPGGGQMNGGWGGLGGQQQAPHIPQQVIEAAKKMGVEPREAAAMYQAMNTSGVFRG